MVLDDHGTCGDGVVAKVPALGEPIGLVRAGNLMGEIATKNANDRFREAYKHLPIRQVAELPVGPRPREIPGTVEHVYSVDAYMRRSEALHSKRWMPTQSRGWTKKGGAE